MNIKDFIRFYKIEVEDELSYVFDTQKSTSITPGDWTDAQGNRTHLQNMDVVACDDDKVHSIVSNWARQLSAKYGEEFKFPINAGSSPRFNRYTSDQKMESHIDHIHSCFDGQFKGVPVLSVIGGLNDDFKGGEFVFQFGFTEENYEEMPIRLGKGDVVVFPSIFPWRHQAMPVTEGIRYSWVSWVW